MPFNCVRSDVITCQNIRYLLFFLACLRQATTIEWREKKAIKKVKLIEGVSFDGEEKKSRSETRDNLKYIHFGSIYI